MVPFVGVICAHVDRAAREVVLLPPEGLMDLATVKGLKRVGSMGIRL